MKRAPGAGPLRRGLWLAALAAALFGVTAPFLERASAGVSPLVAGAGLYLGAAAGAALAAALRRRVRPPDGARPAAARTWSWPGRWLPRLGLVALAGGAAAPALLVLGLRRTDAATASLLLALEAPFTLILARAFLREPVGARVALAAAAIFAGGGLLVGGAWRVPGTAAGAILVAAAALAWAVDNLLSRPLADRDPLLVVVGKGLLGSVASLLAAAVIGEPWPGIERMGPLLAIGAVGYGFSLQLYLRAQRAVGAARTASVFAIAPFVGVITALALGAPSSGPGLLGAAALVAVGLWLHLSERHGHLHHHQAVAHDHPHRHDDGHHDHLHDPMPAGPHSHPHRHDPATHDHEHGEDLHHRHVHP